MYNLSSKNIEQLSFLSHFIWSPQQINDLPLTASQLNRASNDFVKKIVMLKMPYLQNNEVYTASELCGFEADDLNGEQLFVIDRAVTSLAESHQLSLRCIPSDEYAITRFMVR